MDYFLCKNKFSDHNIYFRHLRTTHFLNKSDSYLCCGQVYNAPSFKRHVLKRHKTSSDVVSVSKNECDLVCNVASTSASVQASTTSSKDFVVNLENETFKLDNLSSSFLTFQTQMHSKHNFARKDVEFININIKTLIYEPLLDVFRGFGKRLNENLSPTF